MKVEEEVIKYFLLFMSKVIKQIKLKFMKFLGEKTSPFYMPETQ